MTKLFLTDADGKKHQITEQQLQALAAKGKIQPTTPLETDTGHKGLAGQIPGLKFNTKSKPNGTRSKKSVHQKCLRRRLYLTSAVIVLLVFGLLAGVIGPRTSRDGRLEEGNIQEAFNAEEANIDAKDELDDALLHVVEENDGIESSPPPFVELKKINRTYEDGTKYLYSVTFSPDGKKVITSSSDYTKIWNAESGRQSHTLGYRGVSSIAFSPDGRKVVLGSKEGSIQIRDTESGKELHRWDQQITSAAFSPNGKVIVTANKDTTVRIWHVESARELLRLPGHTSPVKYVAFSPDGDKIASVSSSGQKGTVRIWYVDPVRKSRTSEWQWRTLEWHTPLGSFVGYPGSNGGYVAFSPDSNKIVSFCNDHKKHIGTVRIWCADPVWKWRTLEWHTDNIEKAVFLPDGNKIVTLCYATGDHTVTIIRIWDVEQERESQISEWHIRKNCHLSPDGTKIVTIGSGIWGDGMFRIWDTESGKVQKKWRVDDTREIFRVAFSQDGKKVITAMDNTARIWTLE